MHFKSWQATGTIEEGAGYAHGFDYHVKHCDGSKVYVDRDGTLYEYFTLYDGEMLQHDDLHLAQLYLWDVDVKNKLSN